MIFLKLELLTLANWGWFYRLCWVRSRKFFLRLPPQFNCEFSGRSNFIGTKFTVYDSQPPRDAAIQSNQKSHERMNPKQVSPRVPSGKFSVATISYELNVLRSKGPRRMHCNMHSIPGSAIQEGGTAPTPTEFSKSSVQPFLPLPPLPASNGKKQLDKHSSTSLKPFKSTPGAWDPLTLRNKAPRWHEQLQCWCLNFRGRVTVASIKNFQLVAASEPHQNIPAAEHNTIILQFGKIGKDIFTMDYRYPLSAFQAFAISLSSFGTKLACEWPPSRMCFFLCRQESDGITPVVDCT